MLAAGIAGIFGVAIAPLSFPTAVVFLREDPIDCTTVVGLLNGFAGACHGWRDWLPGPEGQHAKRLR